MSAYRHVRKTFIKLLSALALLVGLLALTTPAANASYSLVTGKVRHEMKMHPPTAQFLCGGGGGNSMGMFAGEGIGVFRSGAVTAGYTGPSYGSIKVVGRTVFGAVFLQVVHDFVKAYDVPWPRADSGRLALGIARSG